MNILDRLTKVFNSSKEINIDDNSRIIIMSDVHRGDGNWSDSFAKNQNTFFTALSYYYKEQYTYIELGDGDELWELNNFKDILREHSDVFWLMSKFYEEDRFYMLYGNHDIVKKSEGFLKDNLYYYYDERKQEDILLFENIVVHEGLVLNYKNDDNKIFLVHGHQVDFINYDIWPITRFLVRHLWRPLELYGVNDVTRTAKNYKKRHKLANKLTQWVMKENHILIAGHNHRPYFPDLESPPYFNDGSCVHPRCITGIEIIDGSIALIKWSVKANEEGLLYVGRDILAGPRKLDFYFSGKG
ncbi:metallophosphoesterase [Tissierella sp. Yu-01]|uniref:metallophosphoesterase n=1 Tax=Tissierella sp. Yu-01 TaxID=3035694 RepID=UPI00240E72AA|nr:metallophosphoesterase [Tissierella sp. Yu-01]WFA07801.1 metallophosphoesterase family protein [Tissierella sp. Yu-01]